MAYTYYNISTVHAELFYRRKRVIGLDGGLFRDTAPCFKVVFIMMTTLLIYRCWIICGEI